MRNITILLLFISSSVFSQVSPSQIASDIKVITASYSATIDNNLIVCNNVATAITVTLPNPASCLDKEINIVRYTGSTGAITVTNSGTASIQAQNGTLGTTTSITAFGANNYWSVVFRAVYINSIYSWIRIK